MSRTTHHPAASGPVRPIAPVAGPCLQRKCACGGSAPCNDCEEEKPKLQRRAEGGAHLSAIPPIVDDVLRSPGRPLDRTIREVMEPRFGHDFGNVRVHDDARAAASARAVQAKAFTLGRDIVFNSGQYAPGSAAGRKLLAHELTHVVQQRGNIDAAPEGVTSPEDASEREADAVADRIVSDGPPPNIIHRSNGLPRLARATFNVGAQPVTVDYGDIISIAPADYESSIETRFASWTGSPATAIHAALTALTDDQKKWVLYGLDILVDNTTAAHAGLDRVQAVQRLIAHAPSALTGPLTGPFAPYATEVLRVSGWLEVALPARLTAPTGSARTALNLRFNPPAAPGAPAGSTLDTALLDVEIPWALTILLTARDPGSWGATGTQSLADLQQIGDIIQTEARTFFSPYADAAMSNTYSSNWLYSANLSSTVSTVPTTASRINYLLNRANIVGGETRPGGTIFARANYDSGDTSHSAYLLGVVTAMEADPNIAGMVDRLIQHTGRTSRATGTPQVAVSTEYDSSTTSECAARWESIDTLTHELVHVLVHPNFPARANSVRFGQVIREGFTEVLGVQLYRHIKGRAVGSPAFKAQMETGITATCGVPANAAIGYRQAGTNAEAIRRAVHDDNFRAAYFLNAVNLVGL